jgi:hypothetical protein
MRRSSECPFRGHAIEKTVYSKMSENVPHHSGLVSGGGVRVTMFH